MSSTTEGGRHLEAPAGGGRTRSRRRILGWTFGVVVGVLLLVALSWLGWQLSKAQDHLSNARDRVPALQNHLVDGDAAAAAADLKYIRTETSRARSATDASVVRGAAGIPYLGRTPHAARSLADISDGLAQGPLPRLITASLALSPNRLRTSGDTIDVRGLQSAAEPLRTSIRELDGYLAQLRSISRGPLVLDPIDNARAVLAANVTSLQQTAIVAGRFAGAGPGMLGSNGTRRYFVAITNLNEIRGSGGVLGGYQILEAREGVVRIAESGPATKLPQLRSWQDANRSPHFPDAAAAWVKLWQQTHPGQPKLDGVISYDPLALSAMLAATGPIDLRRGPALTSTNVLNRVMQQYAASPNPRDRDRSLVGVSNRVLRAVLDGAGNTQNLVRRLGKSSGREHLLIWSTRPDEATILGQAPIGGLFSQARQPFAGVVVSNTGGNKLDRFLRRSVSYFAGDCGSAQRASTIVVRLSNRAPQGLPKFLTARTDKPPKGTPADQVRYDLSLYATAGAKVSSVSIDGKAVKVRTGEGHGHVVFTTDVSIDRRTTSTVTFQLVEPTLPGAPLMPTQPMFNLQENIRDVQVCGRQ